MQIIDNRKNSRWIPVKDILKKVIPLLPKDLTNGIKNIVLIDSDYHRGRNAAARYVPIEGSNKADIEMYFNHYETMPEILKKNIVFIAFAVISSLFHELYHHLIRFHKRHRKPKFKIEQKKADEWAKDEAKKLLTVIFPLKDFKKDYGQLNKIIKQEMPINEV